MAEQLEIDISKVGGEASVPVGLDELEHVVLVADHGRLVDGDGGHGGRREGRSSSPERMDRSLLGRVARGAQRCLGFLVLLGGLLLLDRGLKDAPSRPREIDAGGLFGFDDCGVRIVSKGTYSSAVS